MLLKFTACLLQAAGGDMGKIKAKGELKNDSSSNERT